MKSLFTRILLAMLASTLVALLASALLARQALHSGFEDFLVRQEESHLQQLVPELEDWYRRNGSWERLEREPRRWIRLLAEARPEGYKPPEDGSRELAEPAPRRREGAPRSWMRHAPDQHHHEAPRLWRRLFLLDADHFPVAGAVGLLLADARGRIDLDPQAQRVEAVRAGGQVVGWVGFVRSGVALPEGRQFLAYQQRALGAAAILALALASLLAYWLARNLSLPVRRLRDTVLKLTNGEFEARAELSGVDELGQLARHVNQLAQTLQKNESARRRWTADIAHELRTPIAILQGELDAVNDGVRAPDRATLASLREEVGHLTRLVDDLQALVLADEGALNLRLEMLDLAGLAGQVLDAFSERLSAAQLKLQRDLPESLPLRGDAQRLRQLLHNLLENSIRYTARGGSVRVAVKRLADGVQLIVEDSAPGVSDDQLERLFDRFYRVESSRGRARGGSGLGLAICRTIVEAHGGRINAAHSALGGVRIQVELPEQR